MGQAASISILLKSALAKTALGREAQVRSKPRLHTQREQVTFIRVRLNMLEQDSLQCHAGEELRSRIDHGIQLDLSQYSSCFTL